MSPRRGRRRFAYREPPATGSGCGFADEPEPLPLACESGPISSIRTAISGGIVTESAKKVAQQAEDRLEKVAENVRERFDRVTEGTFSDKIKNGRFADQTDHGIDQGRDEVRRRNQGGSNR